MQTCNYWKDIWPWRWMLTAHLLQQNPCLIFFNCSTLSVKLLQQTDQENGEEAVFCHTTWQWVLCCHNNSVIETHLTCCVAVFFLYRWCAASPQWRALVVVFNNVNPIATPFKNNNSCCNLFDFACMSLVCWDTPEIQAVHLKNPLGLFPRMPTCEHYNATRWTPEPTWLA